MAKKNRRAVEPDVNPDPPLPHPIVLPPATGDDEVALLASHEYQKRLEEILGDDFYVEVEKADDPAYRDCSVCFADNNLRPIGDPVLEAALRAFRAVLDGDFDALCREEQALQRRLYDEGRPDLPGK